MREGRSSTLGDRQHSAAAAKLKQLGLVRGGGPASPKAHRLQFKIFFPRAPYQGAQYTAAKGKDGLYNFTGLVLGHHGSTVQRLQRGSGAKIEIHTKEGNLNGDHPSLGDTSLHALVQADSKAQLQKAVELLLEVLKPTNTTHKPFSVMAGGSVVLQPVPLPGWEEEAPPEQAVPQPAQVQAPPAPNAWLDRARTRQQQAQRAQHEAATATALASKPAAPAAVGQSVLPSWPSGCSDGVTAASESVCTAGGEQSTCSTSTTGSCCFADSSGGGGGGGWEQSSAAAGEEAPREWSLWDSPSSPCLFDQLHSVVQQGLLRDAAGPADAAMLEGRSSLVFGSLQSGLLPFPTATAAWPLQQASHALGPMLIDAPQPLWGGSA